MNILSYIFELLNDDMVDHGLLVQCVDENTSGDDEPRLGWKNVLRELLLSGKVEIGVAKIASPHFVEFVGWKGTVEERVARAIKRVETLNDLDRPFAYWLCLEENVDRFEGEGE
jgi:hypothetical protein